MGAARAGTPGRRARLAEEKDENDTSTPAAVRDPGGSRRPLPPLPRPRATATAGRGDLFGLPALPV